MLTLDELVEEVQSQRGASHKAHVAVTPRMIRYYVANEWLPKPLPGPYKKKYPYDMVWRVLFIRLLVSPPYELPLSCVGEAMQGVPVETMRRVVTGEEPLEVLNAPNDQAVARHEAMGSQVLSLQGKSGHASADEKQSWQVLARTEHVDLRVRQDLPSGKLRQLRLLAALIRELESED